VSLISTLDPVTRVSAAAAYMSEAELYPILGYKTEFVLGRSELDGSRGRTAEAAPYISSEAKGDGPLWNSEP